MFPRGHIVETVPRLQKQDVPEGAEVLSKEHFPKRLFPKEQR